MVRFSTPADFKAFHSDGNKGLIFRAEFLQQGIRESNADLLYVTAITQERIHLNLRDDSNCQGREISKFRANSDLCSRNGAHYINDTFSVVCYA